MNKLFGLFLLALAFLAPGLAQAANRWAVCSTTCTWDNTSTAMWSSVGSGGATGASAPVAGDDVIIDALTCVGGTTCTITTFSGTISAASITWGACTASTAGCIIEAGTNNTNFTLNSTGATTFSGTGTGTRKWNAGTGTYTLTHTGGNQCLSMTTITNDTSVFSAATWLCSGSTTNNRAWQGGGKNFGPTTFSANATQGGLLVTGSNTFTSLTIGAPNAVQFANGSTQTITGALTATGASSSSTIMISSNDPSTAATLSLGSASTATWVAIRAITTSGAAGLTASNCFDLGRNTFANGGTCTGPSAGGGGGGRIIGG